jgi:hypothetical protein
MLPLALAIAEKVAVIAGSTLRHAPLSHCGGQCVERYRAKGLAHSAACSDIRHRVPRLGAAADEGRWVVSCSTVLCLPKVDELLGRALGRHHSCPGVDQAAAAAVSGRVSTLLLGLVEMQRGP